MDRFVTGYLVDSEGFEIDVVSVDLLDTSTEIPSNVIITPPPIDVVLHKRKWDGVQWVEGATQEEIDKLTKVETPPPTQDERIEQLENMILMMMEMM